MISMPVPLENLQPNVRIEMMTIIFFNNNAPFMVRHLTKQTLYVSDMFDQLLKPWKQLETIPTTFLGLCLS
jgi:hypothetical protein